MQRRYEFVLTSTVVQSNIGSTCLYRDVDLSAGRPWSYATIIIRECCYRTASTTPRRFYPQCVHLPQMIQTIVTSIPITRHRFHNLGTSAPLQTTPSLLDRKSDLHRHFGATCTSLHRDRASIRILSFRSAVACHPY